MKTQSEQTPKAPRSGRGRRRSIVLVAATLAFALLAGGVVMAATLDRSEQRGGSVVAEPATFPPSCRPRPRRRCPSPPSLSRSRSRGAEPEPEPESEPESKPDPYALEDGVYPTFIRDVDIHGGEITVDVLQVFRHDDAVRAAVQDGMKRRDARYYFVYVRNENDLLRTVPVARDVKIHFMGVCEVPPNPLRRADRTLRRDDPVRRGLLLRAQRGGRPDPPHRATPRGLGLLTRVERTTRSRRVVPFVLARRVPPPTPDDPQPYDGRGRVGRSPVLTPIDEDERKVTMAREAWGLVHDYPSSS